MKGKRKLAKNSETQNWEAAAAFYESPESLAILAEGEPLSGVEKRKLLGPSRKKLVAIRMPEDDIDSLKKIAKLHKRKYQQLVIHAVELYLDRYQAAVTKKKAI